MLSALTNYLKDFSHLLYPHNCEGCGTDVVNEDAFLCAKCLYNLPVTGFINTPENPVEKAFYGRMNVEKAGAAYYFTKDSLMQHLIFQVKYRNNKNVGIYLGNLLGYQLNETERFNDIDVLVPLPLNAKREFKRGYNQAQLICEGIAEVWPKPIVTSALERIIYTETQTHQTRTSRWENMDGVFQLKDYKQLEGKHIALVDDVTTTGATLEACGAELLKINGLKLSLLTVAYTI